MSEPTGRVLYVAEPPALWRLRQPVVVDCSVLAALLFAEANADEAAALLAGKLPHAPTLLPFEMTNVARSKLRVGAHSEAVQTALEDFDDQRIELHAVPSVPMLSLATRYQLSAYDAAYLWLAGELAAPLATFDRRLAKAAHKHLGQ